MIGQVAGIVERASERGPTDDEAVWVAAERAQCGQRLDELVLPFPRLAGAPRSSRPGGPSGCRDDRARHGAPRSTGCPGRACPGARRRSLARGGSCAELRRPHANTSRWRRRAAPSRAARPSDPRGSCAATRRRMLCREATRWAAAPYRCVLACQSTKTSGRCSSIWRARKRMVDTTDSGWRSRPAGCTSTRIPQRARFGHERSFFEHCQTDFSLGSIEMREDVPEDHLGTAVTARPGRDEQDACRHPGHHPMARRDPWPPGVIHRPAAAAAPRSLGRRLQCAGRERRADPRCGPCRHAIW